MDIKKIEEIDKQNMHKVYDKWPEIAKNAFESQKKTENFEDIEHIVFGGMGGSGAIGDMFASILSKTKIHVNVVKGYVLPETVDTKTLVIIVSVSGNTDETISLLKLAKKTGANIIAFSSGGKIQEYCDKNDINFTLVPKFHSPRATFPSFLYTILKVLYQTLGIKKEYITDSFEKLESLQKKINSSNLTEENISFQLAKAIKLIPIIYYPFGLQSASIRFKNSLQENSKMHAASEDIIEASHNGVVSWEKKSEVIPILIRGTEDHIKTKERYEILKEFFDENKIKYEEIFSVEGNILSKLISLIYLLDYTTIYKAILDNIDPSPVNTINYIKEKLESTGK